MTLDDCKAFSVLAETLHFARAAKRLSMSPSALTRAVQRLEAELGQPLLLRDKRNVALSRAGHLFLSYAQRQLEAHAELRELLAEEAERPTGELRIACTVTACHSILPALLARCRDRYPGINLQLVTSDAVEALSRLQRREAHVAVVPEPDEDPALSFAPLSETPLILIAPRQDRAMQEAARGDGRALAETPLLLPESGLERTRLLQWLRARGVKAPRIYAEVNGNEAIIAMVSLGCGLGLVPELVLTGSPLRNTITALEVPDPPAGYTVGLCAQTRRLKSRALAAFWSLASPSTLRSV